MEEKVSSLPEETIALSSDEGNRPYILLKDIDDKPYWRPYGGEPIEEVRRYHKWEVEAQRHLKEKARTINEVDTVRNAVASVFTIGNLLDMTAEETTTFLEAVCYKISLRWYCADNGIDYAKLTVPTDKDWEDGKIYYQMAMFYVQSYCRTFTLAKATNDVAKEAKREETSTAATNVQKC